MTLGVAPSSHEVPAEAVRFGTQRVPFGTRRLAKPVVQNGILAEEDAYSASSFSAPPKLVSIEYSRRRVTPSERAAWVLLPPARSNAA